MENETSNKKPGRKVSFIVLISIISAFFIYYSIMSMLSPARKLEELKKEFVTKTAEKSEVGKSNSNGFNLS